jgi:radical SAM superfamily enzyme YgiQ (UPF0313 family)
MEWLVKKKGFKSIYFDDDTFNIGKSRMLRLCRTLEERGLRSIPWAIMARADLMDEEILNQMKASGLHAVKYGVESFNKSMLDACHKNMDLKKNTRMIKLTKSMGIKVHLTFCFGFSNETRETIKQTVDYALSLNPDSVQFSVLTPFPGTSLFEELDRKGRILTRDWSAYDGHYGCVFEPDSISPSELLEAKECAYRRWAEYQGKKRGLRGNIRKFFIYYKDHGLSPALKKTADYLQYIHYKRKTI